VSLCPLCLSCFLQPLTQKHLPLLFQTGLRSLPRLQFEFTKFAILNPSEWIFRKFCSNLSCGINSKLSVHQGVSFFVFVSQQTHVGINLLYEHHTLSHLKKYIIRHFLKFSLYCVLVLCRMQGYTIKKKQTQFSTDQ